MSRKLSLAFLFAAWCRLMSPAFAAEVVRNPFESSVVTVEVTSKEYDLMQPWNKPTRSIRKHALVLGSHELVTTAQGFANRTLVRVQKGGRGRWFDASVQWIDYHANVAVISAKDGEFWQGLHEVEVAPSVPRRNDYDIVRWRDGNLEIRRADFSKFTVGEGSLSFSPRIQLELNTELAGLGWAEPVVADGKVVGLTVAKSGNVCTAMPTPFLLQIVEARKSGKFAGLGFFDFVWAQSENPATFEYLKLEGEPRGGVVVEVPKQAGADYAIRRRDVLIEIDGFPIDMEGDFEDPEYGHLMLEGLATRRHFAGDIIPMKVLRDGKIIDVRYVLPRADYKVDLLPMHGFDHEPEYLVAGGLVFQPLSQSYLRIWGEEWRRRAPFRLAYFTSQSPTPERPSLVVLSQVLPDPLNVGYQEYRNIVVDKVNGRVIRKLADLKVAFAESTDGVHRIDFFKGDGLQRMLLDAGSLEESTLRVLKRFGIPKAEMIGE